MPIPFYDLPPEKFPILIEFLHPDTREVLDQMRLDKPTPGKRIKAEIPPVAMLVGTPVAVRITFGDGEVQERTPAGRGASS